MDEKLRILVLGTGQMGAGIARLVLEKSGLELAGVYARRRERGGVDLGDATDSGGTLGVVIENDLASLIERSRPRVAIQATCSRLEDALDEITLLLNHKVSVISIAEEMSCPAASSPERATSLDRLARHQGVALVGTGINPGFVLDQLIITLSGVCAEIRSITATRINDLSPYGPSVLKSQGVGLTEAAFCQGVAEGSVVGHYGFRESIEMISTALGWSIDHIEESREPIVSSVRRASPFVTVEPGEVAGCFHRAVAFREGEAVITLIHPQQIHPELEEIETGDSIVIDGTPPIHLSGSPEIPGGLGTIALAVNMIPRILNASPGLHTMSDLPPPAAMLGDAGLIAGYGRQSHV